MNDYNTEQLSLFLQDQALIRLVSSLIKKSKPGDRFTLEFHHINNDDWQINPDPRWQ